MSDNKFILQLKGTQTPKSVVEIKNDKLVEPFTGVPHSTDVVGGIIDNKDSSVGVAKGAQNWKLDGGSLVVASSLSGDGADYTGEFNASGSGLWINATYSLPDTIFNAGTKWVLKLCGKNLLTTSGETIGFTLVVKVGNTHITSKTFTVAEGANVFCRQLVIDFSESEQAVIKAQSGDNLTVQLLCSDANASATIYNGMTVLTALQRRVDGEVVASDRKTFDEVVQDIDDINDEIDQIHEDIDDLEDYVGDTFVRLDGESIMTGPLKMRATSSFQCAIAPFWDGVGFYKLNSDDSVTLIASVETPDGFVPWVTNTYNIGSSLKKWRNLYLGEKLFVSTINNGGDLTVPANTTGTLATKADVDLAANSGDQLTEKGVWYAKMYSATVAPSAEDGTNYADFSQTDGQGNPIIVIYKRQNGAWVQDQTITPPAEYNGYVPITSKIWDIVEQSGQQGGKILWSHNQKTFTPSPLIISFEDIEITGDSTVIMPQNPGANQIVNKDYVDDAIAAIPTPTVDITQSIDAEIVGSVTVTDAGDVTGFTQNDYLLYPGCMNVASAGSLELFFAFTTNTATNGISLFVPSLSGSGVENVSLTSTTNAQDVTTLRFVVSSGLNQISIYGTTPILPNTKYYAKVIYDGTDYSLSVSTDNVVWISEGTVTATIVPGAYTQGRYRIGINGAPLISNSGIKTMHMKECYIKEGGIVTWQGLGDPGLHQRVSKAEADYVVESQFPTAENNLTWYRKYKSGWVEQGQRSLQIANRSYGLYTLPVPMADTDYWAAAGPAQISTSEMYNAASTVAALAGTTTQVRLGQYNTANATMRIWWEVKGMYAQ